MIGNDIHKLAQKLWGINRSITGEGVRETLSLLRQHMPNLEIKSVSSGTKVFDWTVPREWKVSEAYVIAPNGDRILDFSVNNLHLVGYSVPFQGKLSLQELNEHLHSLPDQPEAIPYITSYYAERWGFCLSQEQRDQLKDGDYDVIIDSELFEGVLNYAELILPGETQDEVFLSTYVCHPSMANNELSGPTVVTYIAKWLQNLGSRKYTYRIIFVPETIGSITYLSMNYRDLTKNVVAGFNVSCVGDNRGYSYLPSRDGRTLSDKVARHVLHHIDPNYSVYKWIDRGSDERQYCAPGIDLPIASIMRTKYGQYPEYHTSLDDLVNVVTPKGLDGGYWSLRRALELLEKNFKYKVNVYCEPQMGKRGLYPTLSTKNGGDEVRFMMDFLSYCDGKHDLVDIAEKIDAASWDLYELATILEKNGLITAVNE